MNTMLPLPTCTKIPCLQNTQFPHPIAKKLPNLDEKSTPTCVIADNEKYPEFSEYCTLSGGENSEISLTNEKHFCPTGK
jgi:hypothetical protein